MAEQSTVTQIQEVPEWLKVYQQDILQQAQGLAGNPALPPEVQVAGVSPYQNQAYDMASQGVGAYFPMLQGGAQTQGTALGTLGQGTQMIQSANPWFSQAMGGIQPTVDAAQQGAQTAADRARSSTAQTRGQLSQAGNLGLNSAQQGIAGLRGSSAMFNPAMAQGFMNPYETGAINSAMDDLQRSGDIQKQGVRANAVSAGAFGGSRAAIAERELDRNVMDQQMRTSAAMRNAGYTSSLTAAQQAFEAQKARQQGAAQLTGQLGNMGAGAATTAASAGGNLALNTENLAQTGAIQGGQLGLSGAQGIGSLAGGIAQAGTQMGSLGQAQAGVGMNQAQLGEAYQGLNLNDVNTMNTLGTQQQAQRQAELDARRLNEQNVQMQPYQQLGFYSDIYQGMPSSSSTLTNTTQPSPSMLSQLGGLGMGVYGLSQAWNPNGAG